MPMPFRHRTARFRLTVLYGGLFLLLGTALIVLIYGLTRSSSQAIVVAPDPVKRAIAAGATPSKLVAPAFDAQHSADLSRLLATSWVVLAISAVAAGLLGWFAAGRVLRPVRTITDTARTISAGNLHQRLALTGPDDEFKRLGDTLDELLARLEASFEAQRRFVANASHELRTPLTLERTLLQVALADPDATAGTLRATCEELLAAGRHQEQLLESLLTLASSERGLERREVVDLATIASRAVKRAPIASAGLTVTEELTAAPLTGDPALLTRLADNLIENAIDHNVPDGRIAVSTGVDEGRARLTVTNTGPEIPADEAERLFEPFHRGPATRRATDNGHHGLGLSIVRAIAAVHGATVTATPNSDGGLSVTFSAPANLT